MTTGGFYRDVRYPHNPGTELKLFTHSLVDYLQETDELIAGIEIGVLNGDTSKLLLGINQRILLIGIDPIIPDSMESTLIGSIFQIEKNLKPYEDRWTFYQNYSYNVYKLFANKSIDFIFFDGSHHYEDVKEDYKLYLPKIKKGGMLYFHDSRMNRGGANFHVGSSRLVDELIENDKKIELIGEAFSLTCFKKL